MPTGLTLGDVLREQRAVRGLSRAELARRAGITTRALDYLERGLRTDPRSSTVVALARALDEPPATFLAALN